MGVPAWCAAALGRVRQAQSAYVESFNGRLSAEFRKEDWFPSLLRARTEIETWRR